MKKKIIIIFLIILVFFISLIIYSKTNKKNINSEIEIPDTQENIYSSNIIQNVNYSSMDSRGNQYNIYATKGEIDYSNSNLVYLTNVKAVIRLSNSNQINIFSDFGKYNTDNFDTIFSKNVIIDYLDNKIVGEYLDFSIKRNSMIISKNVTFTNLENTLKADIIEINLETKDTIISMYNRDQKVNIINNR